MENYTKIGEALPSGLITPHESDKITKQSSFTATKRQMQSGMLRLSLIISDVASKLLPITEKDQSELLPYSESLLGTTDNFNTEFSWDRAMENAVRTLDPAPYDSFGASADIPFGALGARNGRMSGSFEMSPRTMSTSGPPSSHFEGSNLSPYWGRGPVRGSVGTGGVGGVGGVGWLGTSGDSHSVHKSPAYRQTHSGGSSVTSTQSHLRSRPASIIAQSGARRDSMTSPLTAPGTGDQGSSSVTYGQGSDKGEKEKKRSARCVAILCLAVSVTLLFVFLLGLC